MFWLNICELKDCLIYCAWIGLWTLGFLFLGLRLGGVGIHWAIVFVPFLILIFAGIGLLLFIGGNILEDRDARYERVYGVLALLCLSVFLILLAVQLESNVYWSWQIVFIPLYIIDGLGFIYFISVIILGLCIDLPPDEIIDYDVELALIFSGGLDLGVFTPFLIFKILLGLTLDGIKDYTFAGMGSTIFVVESLVTLFYCSVGLMLLFD